MSEGFTINKAYAAKYDKWRETEELQKLKDKYGDVDADTSSSSETEDEDAEALTSQLEKDWLTTLAALKRKDPKIYEKDALFYHEKSDDSEEKKGKKKKDKPMYLKDYERKVILEKEGHLSDDSDSDNDNKYKMGYFEQQKEIKKSISQAISDSDDSGDEFLQKKAKSKEEEDKEEEVYLEWLKGQKQHFKDEKQVGIELESLKDYWNNPDLDKGEKFLRDFFLNKGYKERDSENVDDMLLDGGEGMSDEEEILEKQEEFERKYNFRYEEPDKDFIKSYPRVISESVRQKPSKRAEKRKEIKDRKEQEQEKRKDELKQLKNLKKKEILRKIDQLKDIAGNPEMGLSEGDLDEDFDPNKHDAMMKKFFDEEYYGMAGEEQKPEYPDEMEDLKYENWDAWDGEKTEEGDPGGGDEAMEREKEGREREDMEGPHVDDPDFNMDADYDPTQAVSSKKKRKKKSKFAQALARNKPVFNPEEKTFEQYLDEYYSLDYEDMVGDRPCRFRYRQVPANNYGLGVDEILKCREKELNAWVSLKKIVQYRTEEEEKLDSRIYQAKAKNVNKKLNVLTTLKEERDKKEKFEKKQERKLEKQTQQAESLEGSQSKGKIKDKSKANKRRQQVDTVTGDSIDKVTVGSGHRTDVEGVDVHSPKKKKRPNDSEKDLFPSVSKEGQKSGKGNLHDVSSTGQKGVVQSKTSKKKNKKKRTISGQNVPNPDKSKTENVNKKMEEKMENSEHVQVTAGSEGGVKKRKKQRKKKNSNSSGSQALQSNTSNQETKSQNLDSEAKEETLSPSTAKLETEQTKKKKRKKKKKLNSSDSPAQQTNNTSNEETKSQNTDSETKEETGSPPLAKSEADETKKKKRKKKKKKKQGGLPKLSAERLLAYGINPKKLKYLKTDNYKGPKEQL